MRPGDTHIVDGHAHRHAVLDCLRRCLGIHKTDTEANTQIAQDACGNREDNDVSADTDPNTGTAIYNSYAVGSGYSSVPGWGTPDGVSAFTS